MKTSHGKRFSGVTEWVKPAIEGGLVGVGIAETLDGQRKKLPKMAERVGFEPTVRFKTDNALAGRPIRPLWHLSWER